MVICTVLLEKERINKALLDTKIAGLETLKHILSG